MLKVIDNRPLMAFVPPARHLLRAKDLADARYFEPLDVDDLAARRRPLARALQPRVPARVRRVAARLPAHPAPRARRGAAAHHRPLGRRHLLLRRPAERRLVHHQLHAHVRHARRPPTARPSRRRPQQALVPACVRARLRAPATPHVSRRQRLGADLAWLGDRSVDPRRDHMIKIANAQLWVHDQDEALAFYTAEARHGGARPTSRSPRWATSAGSPSARPASPTSRSC